MNFLSEEQEMWKSTVARWIENEIGREYVRKCDVERTFPYEAYEKAAQLGWLRLLIPENYGGDGGDIFSYALMCEALSKYGVDFCIAITASTFNVMSLVHHGSPELKEKYISPFMRGEIRIPVSISEPNAGSDLANVQTFAEDAGDHYIVNGQKTWTSGGQWADKCFALVRTDKSQKHGGISFLLFDMASEGVSTRPILLISGYSPFCETFFDNVKVPKSQRVHEENKGWDVAKYLLGHEREMISGMGAWLLRGTPPRGGR